MGRPLRARPKEEVAVALLLRRDRKEIGRLLESGIAKEVSEAGVELFLELLEMLLTQM